jgi:hypothetical protein
VETMLPVWKSEQATLYEQKIAQIAAEKKLAEERRQRTLQQLEREEQLKTALASEQQSLSMMLALERIDLMEKQTAHALRRGGMNAAAESAQREIFHAASRLEQVQTEAWHAGYSNPVFALGNDISQVDRLYEAGPAPERVLDDRQQRQLQDQLALQSLVIQQQRDHLVTQLITQETKVPNEENVNKMDVPVNVGPIVNVTGLPRTSSLTPLTIESPASVPPPKPVKRPSISSVDPTQTVAAGASVDNSSVAGIVQAASQLPRTGSSEGLKKTLSVSDLIPLKPPRAGSFLKPNTGPTMLAVEVVPSAEKSSTGLLSRAGSQNAVVPSESINVPKPMVNVDTSPVAVEKEAETVSEAVGGALPSTSSSRIDKILGLQKDIDEEFAGEADDNAISDDDEFLFDAGAVKAVSGAAMPSPTRPNGAILDEFSASPMARLSSSRKLDVASLSTSIPATSSAATTNIVTGATPLASSAPNSSENKTAAASSGDEVSVRVTSNIAPLSLATGLRYINSLIGKWPFLAAVSTTLC